MAARALEELPELGESLRDGVLSWSALRELTRVATPETEREWLDAARSRTARDVEKLVSGHRPGNRPSDTADASARRHVLRLEVSGEVFASFREAMAKLRRDAGEPLDDDAAILLMARHVLAGPKDEGRASYQVAMTVCEACKNGKKQGRGELIDVGTEVVAMAECDAQHIGNTHVGAAATRAKQDVPPATRRLVVRRDGGRCIIPGCRHGTFLDVHHIDPRAEGGDHDPENLVTLCSAHHRAIHRGEVVVDGRVSAGLRFRHADGSEYGGRVSPSSADLRAKAFQALTGMGFREGEVRRALERVVAHVGSAANIEKLVGEGLLALTAKGAPAS